MFLGETLGTGKGLRYQCKDKNGGKTGGYRPIKTRGQEKIPMDGWNAPLNEQVQFTCMGIHI